MRILYSVDNLRSLSEVQPVELKPITILVGRNSAGKSTFLRSLPLLRQSVEARASAPILWYGSLVDFGDFATSVRDRDANKIITFHFEAHELDIIDEDFSSARYFSRLPGSARRRRTNVRLAMIEIDIGSQLGRTVKRSVRYSVPDQSLYVNLELAKDGNLCERAMVNGIDVKTLVPDHYLYFSGNGLFASPQMARDTRDGDARVRQLVPFQFVLAELVASIITPLVDKRIGSDKIADESSRILGYPVLDASSFERLARRSEIRAFKKLYSKWSDDPNHPELERVRWCNSCFQALSMYSKVSRAISEVFSSTSYLGPARARGERFYRLQELEVSEIAPNGENLPMFLASLSPSELVRFSDWVERLFGYGVAVEETPGHISVNLKRDNFRANVADTGYGVSQVLPVLAQTWWATQRTRRLTSGFTAQNSIRLVAMEQPELHLHPAHQALLADVFVEATRSSKTPTHFVIETHSEAMINRLGELIEAEKVAADSVQILIFATEQGGDSSNMSVSNFSSNGVLEKWPFGFFSY